MEATSTIGTRGADTSLWSYRIVDAIGGSDNSRDGDCSTAEITGGQEDHHIDHNVSRLDGDPGGRNGVGGGGSAMSM